MKKNERILLVIGSSFVFLDSISFFFLDPKDNLTLIVVGSERASNVSFKTKEEAEKELKNLIERLIMQKNIVNFAGKYLVSDKISFLSLDVKENDKNGERVLKIFFESGAFIDEEFLMNKKKEEEIDQLISDLRLGKIFKIGEEITIVFDKIVGMHLGFLENQQSGLFIETKGHEIPIMGSPESLRILIEEIYNLSKFESVPIYS